MKSDIEIAQSADIKPIEQVACQIGIDGLEMYGKYKAKVNNCYIKKVKDNADGKLILVTAITPTPAGEGKTTTSIGLADALKRLDKKVMLCLREPSLGPVFGMKGGAAGGGYSQVIPMEDINLHFTGDLHAIAAANNLLAAMIDNHIYHGNELGIDVRKITWKRCVDINDRQLRFIVDGLNKINGVPREDGFDITVATEVMAALCLSEDMNHLKKNLEAIIVGYTLDGKPVTAGHLKAHGAMAALLKDALKPNLVQTLEHTPTFIHGGPFANIAHGCNSVIATKTALKTADYVVTESGFGADLGAEKFFDIKCRIAALKPAVAVIVATVRALRHHNPDSLHVDCSNLLRHIDNIKNKFGVPTVVAINRFPDDTDQQLNDIKQACMQYGVEVALSDVWAKGGEGGIDLAQKVMWAAENVENNFRYIYSDQETLKKKIEIIAGEIYRADRVEFSAAAAKELAKLQDMGFGHLPICMAKTQYSFSDNPKKLGAPENFNITIKNVKISAGAGFVVAYSGDIMTMPGLPKRPAAHNIDVDNDGVISGLF